MLSLVPPFAKGEFFFRTQDLTAQQEFLSYPRGKNDDIMDALYYADYYARAPKSDAVKKESFKTEKHKSGLIPKLKKYNWLTGART